MRFGRALNHELNVSRPVYAMIAVPAILPSISPNRVWRVIFIAVPEGVAAFMVIRP
jgi:hypothetical protein